MTRFLILFTLMLQMIRCARENNVVVPPPCDTCSHKVDTGGSKTDTTKKTLLDTIPFSITILGDSSFLEKLSSPIPVSLSVVVKNKAGNFIKGVPVVFSAGLNSGSLNHDTIHTDTQGMVNAIWTLGPQADTAQRVTAKVVYKNTSLSVGFQALLTHDTTYNYTGTLTMDSTNMPGGAFVGFTGDSTNAPDPFTFASDS
ncbi:MAG TPA: hypothetical protein VHT72_08460, partial [Puia sp.]|nr:hypothetical protein [Puia sp.]